MRTRRHCSLWIVSALLLVLGVNLLPATACPPLPIAHFRQQNAAKPKPKDDNQSKDNQKGDKPASDSPHSASPQPSANAATAQEAGQKEGAPKGAVNAPEAAANGAESNASPRKNIVVWVNTASRVYHLPGSRWYGKTKHGKYMTEEDARKAGYHPAGKE